MNQNPGNALELGAGFREKRVTVVKGSTAKLDVKDQ